MVGFIRRSRESQISPKISECVFEISTPHKGSLNIVPQLFMHPNVYTTNLIIKWRKGILGPAFAIQIIREINLPNVKILAQLLKSPFSF